MGKRFALDILPCVLANYYPRVQQTVLMSEVKDIAKTATATVSESIGSLQSALSQLDLR